MIQPILKENVSLVDLIRLYKLVCCCILEQYLSK